MNTINSLKLSIFSVENIDISVVGVRDIGWVNSVTFDDFISDTSHTASCYASTTIFMIMCLEELQMEL